MEEILLVPFPRDPFFFASCALGLLCLILLLAVLRQRRTAQRRQETFSDLHREYENRDRALEKTRTEFRELLSRQPDAVMKAAEHDRLSGNFAAADRRLAKWQSEQGPAAARVLLERARWCYLHAKGDRRPAALAAAEAYAAAAVTLTPNKGEMTGFFDEIRTLRKTESRAPVTLAAAVTDMQAQTLESGSALDLFETDPALAADDAEREAGTQYDQGRYHLALAAILRTLDIRQKTDGAESLRSLNALSLKGYVLFCLGRTKEALTITRGVVERMSANAVFGPDHPDTLTGRFELARMLADAGRADEAATLVRDVAERQSASPELGPDHPDTRASQDFLRTLTSPEAAPGATPGAETPVRG